MEDGVSFHANLPLEWQPLGDAERHAVEVWMHTNVVLLRALSTIEAQPPLSDYENEPGSPTGRMLERLEAKVDLALALMGRLLSQEQPAPWPTPLTLSARAVEWQADALPPAGSPVLITLHISPRLPQPLRLAAIVKHSGQGSAKAVFTHLGEEMQDWLERTVFRQHRRHIQARHLARKQEN
jgi:hypothetical protein